MSRRRRKRAQTKSTRPAAAREPRESSGGQSPPAPRWTPTDRAIFWLAFVLPAALCAIKLPLDLWYDEAYTLHQFAAKPLAYIATNYPSPNNHVLFSMLLRPFYLLYLMTGMELSLRLPALLISLGTLAGVYALGKRLVGPTAGTLAVLALGLTQMFLVHTMQLRGYGLSMLLGVCLAHFASGGESKSPLRRALAITLFGAAWLYTLPTNALFLAAMTATALLIDWIQERRAARVCAELAIWTGPWILAALLYTPIYGQVLEAAGESSGAFTFAAAARQTAAFCTAACRDSWPLVVVAAIGLGFWLAGGRTEEKQKKAWTLPILAALMLSVPLLVGGLVGMIPFVRNYTPVLPFLALGIGWLLHEGAAGLARLMNRPAIGRHSALIGGLLLVVVLVPRLITYPARLDEFRRGQFAQDGYFNYYAARYEPSAVIDYLRRAIDPAEPYLVCYHEADHAVMLHYAAVAGLPLGRSGEDRGEQPRVRVYYVQPDAPLESLGRLTMGLSLEQVVDMPLVDQFGYYRVRRSEGLIEVPRGEGP